MQSTGITPQDLKKKQSTATPEIDIKAIFNALPGLFLVFLPDDPVFTIVAASDEVIRVSGIQRGQIINRSVFEVFPDNPEDTTSQGNAGLRASLQRVLATSAPDRMELQRYDLQGPDGFDIRFWSALNTPVFDADGRIAFLLHSNEDVTASNVNKLQLETSEKRFRQLAETTGFGLLIGDCYGGLSYLNPTALAMLGYTKEDVAAGNVRWDRITPTEYAAQDVAVLREIAETGRCAPYEKAYIRKDGEQIPVLIGASALQNASGQMEVAAIVLDLGERRQSEKDNFLVRLDDATRPLSDPDEITQTAARLVGQHLGVNRCTYANVDKDQDTHHVTGDFASGAASIVGRHTFSDFGAEFLEAMRAGLPFVLTDSEEDPRSGAVVDSYRKIELRSVICIPLQKSGRLVAALAVHQTKPRKWRSDEIELLKVVANRCWESLERSRIAWQLRDSEQRLRLAQKAGRVGSFDWRMKEGLTVWSPELEALFGLAPGSFDGTLDGWKSRVFPEDAKRVLAQIKDCVAKQQGATTYEYRAVLPDGSLRWLLSQGQFHYDEAGVAVRMVGVNIDIDTQKRAELQLKQQWHTFDTALTNIPDSVYVLDADHRFRYANRALLKVWGTTLQHVLGKNFHELGYPQDIDERVSRQLRQVIETKEPLREESDFTTGGGDLRRYEYIFTPVLTDAQEVEAIVGMSHDITESYTAEKQGEADRRRWREMLSQAPAAIAVLRGPNHRFEWCNDDYLRLVGRTAEFVIGKPVRDAIPEVESQIYIQLLDEVYRTGRPFTGRELLVSLDRGGAVLTNLYVNFAYLATRNVAGEIDGIFVHAVDVTDMVVARKQVEESEKQFRTLAETIPHLAWMADETGYIFWYNRRWYDYTGTTHAEMEGWGWQKVHDPSVLPEAMRIWTAGIATGTPVDLILPLRAANGEFRPFLTRVEPVKDSEGRVVRWFGTNTDITEQQKVQEELRRMNRELEEFAYVASHDLQEPLRMVNIYTQLILKALHRNDPTLNQHAAYVEQGVKRMETLIRDLLKFSRTVLDAEVQATPAHLSASLREAMAVLQDRIQESDAVISVHPLPIVLADEGQLAHVFQNLLTNAIKYRQHGLPLEIEISAVLEEDCWTISVRDNGIGFDQQYAERIFGLFKRLHKNAYPGTGLGLAICQRIVERYGGRIWAEGRPGNGATFRFSLPSAPGTGSTH